MYTQTKICGLSTEDTLDAALRAGAAYVGFVFFPPSPRNVSIERASELTNRIADDIRKVGVFVNPDDRLLADAVQQAAIDIIQLHGSETPERVQQIKEKFAVPVMKAIAVAGAADIERAHHYEPVADILLFDAKAPADMDDALPGGNGLAFDWNLIAGQQWKVPWMLSGGLDETNVSEAIKISGAGIVDVSSGIEKSPGVKDMDKINAFLKAVQETE